MINVVIVEDNHLDEIKLREALQKYGQDHKQDFSITSFSSGLDFLSKYKLDADLIFMDIQLKDIDGMECSSRLRKIDSRAILVFVTNMPQFAIQGYAYDAKDYLLKPVKYSSFNLKMDRIINFVNQIKTSDDFIIINFNNHKTKILKDDILFVEVNQHRIIYHTRQEDFEINDSLSNVEKLLNDKYFFRSNYCYLVNIKRIDKIDKDTVIIGKYNLPISRSRKKDFINALSLYYGGNNV